ncbi:MAG TPA: hypothetical protein VJ898_07795 [Natrialbaceae archaeon]|nr:hypothetical protein [Natrialbaceae archaeon]
MPFVTESNLVGYDAEAAVGAARDATDAELLAAASYTADGHQLLYVSDAFVDRYGSREAADEVTERVHSYIRLDLIERDLFDDLVPAVGETRAFTTHTDTTVIVRVLAGDEGFYCSFMPGAEVTAVVEAVEAVIDGGRDDHRT